MAHFLCVLSEGITWCYECYTGHFRLFTAREESIAPLILRHTSQILLNNSVVCKFKEFSWKYQKQGLEPANRRLETAQRTGTR